MDKRIMSKQEYQRWRREAKSAMKTADLCQVAPKRPHRNRESKTNSETRVKMPG